MEAVPGTAQSDSSCRNPPEHPEMPGEGPAAEGHMEGASLGRCLYPLPSKTVGRR